MIKMSKSEVFGLWQLFHLFFKYIYEFQSILEVYFINKFLMDSGILEIYFHKLFSKLFFNYFDKVGQF